MDETFDWIWYLSVKCLSQQVKDQNPLNNQITVPNRVIPPSFVSIQSSCPPLLLQSRHEDSSPPSFLPERSSEHPRHPCHSPQESWRRLKVQSGTLTRVQRNWFKITRFPKKRIKKKNPHLWRCWRSSSILRLPQDPLRSPGIAWWEHSLLVKCIESQSLLEQFECWEMSTHK